ncbi:MAG: hypothetical protein ABI847_20665, partial [Anaerolineales bacterium]
MNNVKRFNAATGSDTINDAHQKMRWPLLWTLAVATMLAAGTAFNARAADVELWSPPGGNVVVKDSTG